MPSAGSAPEMTVTPRRSQAPETKGTIPAQMLTAGGDAESVDVAAYFGNPAGNELTCSAVSDGPDVVRVATSESALTFTPISTGTATVAVPASDGTAEAVQTVAVTVSESLDRPAPAQHPATVSPPAQEPEKRLMGIRITLGRRSDREAFHRQTGTTC